MVSLINYPKRKLRKLVRSGEYLQALKLGKELEKKLPNDPDLFFIIAGIYYMNGDAKNSLLYLDKVLEIAEYDIEALMLKASVHINLKDKQKALDCRDKIKEVDPENKAVDEILDEVEKI